MNAPEPWNATVTGDVSPRPEPILEFERRSRAVLVADVVGYTRLMEVAEVATHARYRRICVDCINPLIVSHRGETVKNTGDGFVAVFETPRDAVNCAMVMQRDLSDQESGRHAGERIAFRMGLHWQPVIFDLNDVYGHGVNTAVRLQEIAPEGGLVVSGGLIDALGDTKDLLLHDLGEVKLKNFARLVPASEVIIPGLAAGNRRALAGGRSHRASLPMVAVLPFRNFSDAGDYFADGLIEDIIASLSSQRELMVVSRGSTIVFREQVTDPLEVGQKFGAQYVVTGTIRRAGAELKLSVEMVSVADATVIWAERYSLELPALFELQDDIAIKIVGKITAGVQVSQIRSALRKPPQSLNAYDHFLQALDLIYRLDYESFARARQLLARAVEEDPDYAAPYALAAHWHMFNIAEGWATDVSGEAEEVIRLCNLAIERDPSNALAFATKGHAKAMFYRDYDAGIECVERSVSLSPSSSWAWILSSGPYGFIGETGQAIERAERAIRLSPVDRHAFFNLCVLAQNHHLHGNFNDAIRWSRKALALNSRFGNSIRVLAASLVEVGRHAEAEIVAHQHRLLLPGFTVSNYAKRCPFKQPAADAYVKRLRDAGLPD